MATRIANHSHAVLLAAPRTEKAMNPTPAAPSIIPSIPMLMMPDRSDHRPVMAPRAMGVASTSDWSNRTITLVHSALADSARAIPMMSGTARAAAMTWARRDLLSCLWGRKLRPATAQ